MNRRIYLSMFATALAAASCSSATSPKPDAASHTPAAWSYEGDSGPALWNKLDPEYATCGYGTTQSPVDITKTMPVDLPNIVFHYQPSKLKIQNIDYTVQLDVDEGNSIEVNGESYDLVQLRIHVPSEHRVNGKLADAELHLIHRNVAGQLAIIAILLRIGSEDTVLGNVWNNIPPVPGPGKSIEGAINLEEILPPHRWTYRYDGSLTIPPCTEVVTWLVMRDTMHVGATQLQAFKSVFKSNNRPVQPLNHRMVLMDTSIR